MQSDNKIVHQQDEYFYFYTLSRHLCVVMITLHALLLGAYLALGVPEMFILSFIGIGLHIAALTTNNAKKFETTWSIINGAVLSYCALSVYHLGNTGMQNVIMFLPMLFFLYPINFNVRFLYLLLIAGLYMGLNYVQLSFEPVYILPMQELEYFQIALGTFTLCALAYFIFYAYQAIKKQENDMLQENTALRCGYREMEKRATFDALTRAYNRFKIETILSYELERSRRHKTVFSVIIVDIDHFKQVNDTYGHAAGDHVLQEFADILTQNSRKLDSIGRWGGEEFIIISPETNGDGVKILAEKLRKKVEEHIFDKGLKVTASFGAGALDPKSDWESFFERIDAALYESKENGRNRVTVG